MYVFTIFLSFLLKKAILLAKISKNALELKQSKKFIVMSYDIYQIEQN